MAPPSESPALQHGSHSLIYPNNGGSSIPLHSDTIPQGTVTSQKPAPRALSCYFPIKYQLLHFIFPTNNGYHMSFFSLGASCNITFTLLLVQIPITEWVKKALHDHSRSPTPMSEAVSSSASSKHTPKVLNVTVPRLSSCQE